MSYIPNKTIHFIILTETWIKSDTDANNFQIPHFSHYYNCRQDRRGGGVSIFVHNNLTHQLSESTFLEGKNYLWIYIEQLSLNVGVIYKPGDTNINEFISTYETQLDKSKRTI